MSRSPHAVMPAIFSAMAFAFSLALSAAGCSEGETNGPTTSTATTTTTVASGGGQDGGGGAGGQGGQGGHGGGSSLKCDPSYCDALVPIEQAINCPLASCSAECQKWATLSDPPAPERGNPSCNASSSSLLRRGLAALRARSSRAKAAMLRRVR